MEHTAYTLITGASSGIGRELAFIAAAEGRNVVLVARSTAKLNTIANELTKKHGIHSEVIACDLSQPAAAHDLYASLQKKNIFIDVLINNAGFGDHGIFIKSDREKQLSMIDLNVRALTELTHLLLPAMVAHKHGYVMNVSSVAGFLPGPLMSVYFATKAYVLSFSEALSEELRGSGVSITCLAPGSTKTNFGENANVSSSHSTRTSTITAAQVAEYGWKAMIKGETIAVHRASNRSAIWIVKILPRNIVRKIVHHINT